MSTTSHVKFLGAPLPWGGNLPSLCLWGVECMVTLRALVPIGGLLHFRVMVHGHGALKMLLAKLGSLGSCLLAKKRVSFMHASIVICSRGVDTPTHIHIHIHIHIYIYYTPQAWESYQEFQRNLEKCGPRQRGRQEGETQRGGQNDVYMCIYISMQREERDQKLDKETRAHTQTIALGFLAPLSPEVASGVKQKGGIYGLCC